MKVPHIYARGTYEPFDRPRNQNARPLCHLLPARLFYQQCRKEAKPRIESDASSSYELVHAFIMCHHVVHVAQLELLPTFRFVVGTVEIVICSSTLDWSVSLLAFDINVFVARLAYANWLKTPGRVFPRDAQIDRTTLTWLRVL